MIDFPTAGVSISGGTSTAVSSHALFGGSGFVLTFAAPGILTITNTVTVYYLLVGGGGGGAQGDGCMSSMGGGGGAGGVIQGSKVFDGPATYTITVGAGGASNASGSPTSITGLSGNLVNFSTSSFVAVGGGTGQRFGKSAPGGGAQNAQPGGSGGGGGGVYLKGRCLGGSGIAGQGFPGGINLAVYAGAAAGGGGAGGRGGDVYSDSTQTSGAGGLGTSSLVTGVLAYYGCGGSGGAASTSSIAGRGFGGKGAQSSTPATTPLVSSGGGGGGGNTSINGASAGAPGFVALAIPSAWNSVLTTATFSTSSAVWAYSTATTRWRLVSSSQTNLTTVSTFISTFGDQNYSTGYFSFPTGNTAQRPGSPIVGYVRFNTDSDRLEVYNGFAWVNVH